MTRNNSQYLISLGRCKSISRELGKPPYGAVYMKETLQEHFGEKIVIITVNNRNVVSFRSTVGTIISELYKQPKVDDYEVDQIRIAASLKKVWKKITTGTSFVQLECLPPTSAAAVCHGLRVYHQVQQWRGIALPPPDWMKTSVWKTLPVRTDPPAAHASLLEIVRCNCKSDCGSQRCSCKKQGMDCLAACGTCRENSCMNSASPDLGKDDE